MKIILDCFGGDNCPDSAIDGAILALQDNKNLEITLCGDESAIGAYLADKQYDKARVKILHASEVVTNDDVPTLAVRRKRQSSMMVGLQTLASSQDYDGFVSSGNTGALLVGATIFVKLVDGAQRATLSPLLPTMIDGKQTILVDGGANVDCKASMLKEFAIMGSEFMSSMGIENPKVALLNNGTEEEKGNALTKEAHALLKDCDINFVGNIEAREMFAGGVDVIVADGFAGNMILKSAEGMGNTIFSMLKRYITEGGLRAKLGYLLLKPSLKKLKGLMSSDAVGGGVFLGVKKVVVKAHGASNATAFKNAIVRACEMASGDACGKIARALLIKNNKEQE